MIKRAWQLTRRAFNLAATTVEYIWVLGIAAVEAFNDAPMPDRAPEPIVEPMVPAEPTRPIEDPEAYGERLERLTRESFAARNVNVATRTKGYVPGSHQDPFINPKVSSR